MADATHRRAQQVWIDSLFILAEIIFVCQYDVFLDVSASVEIVCLGPCQNRFRHASNKQVGAEVFHEFIMEGLI